MLGSFSATPIPFQSQLASSFQRGGSGPLGFAVPLTYDLVFGLGLVQALIDCEIFHVFSLQSLQPFFRVSLFWTTVAI